jgi:hypothetical protein
MASRQQQQQQQQQQQAAGKYDGSGQINPSFVRLPPPAARAEGRLDTFGLDWLHLKWN